MSEEHNSNEPRVVQTDIGAQDGQNKCPQCGATDISLNAKTGMLRCNFCRHEFEPENVEGFESDISQLQGEIIGSGTQDIVSDTQDMITLKCSSCGAEVVIDTSQATQARCHWCRNTLSINQQVPNGSVPDVVLPFKLTKAEAKDEIEKFVGKRKFFAHPKFREEFTTDNVMGVYFPYMVVDVNAHASFSGQGEHKIRSYKRKVGETERTYYDADLYDVERDFDLTIEGLTVESSQDKLDVHASDKTNNIINSIMPFDVENSVKWNANYLHGYTSEKRDTNIDQLKPLVKAQAEDVARFAANDTLKQYDRGVRWSHEELDIKGRQWKSAYFPVWLYSYMQEKGDKQMLHYVAVNARTKETMGSVPIHMPLLLLMSAIVEILAVVAMLFVEFKYEAVFLIAGVIYFLIMYLRYRNSNARHHHETETIKKMSSLRQRDVFIKRETGLSNSRISGANNTAISGIGVGEKILNSLKR